MEHHYGVAFRQRRDEVPEEDLSHYDVLSGVAREEFDHHDTLNWGRILAFIIVMRKLMLVHKNNRNLPEEVWLVSAACKIFEEPVQYLTDIPRQREEY